VLNFIFRLEFFLLLFNIILTEITVVTAELAGATMLSGDTGKATVKTDSRRFFRT
jgi:hypothetical protein